MIAQGDRIGFHAGYSVGAIQYAPGTNVGSPGLFAGGNTLALGVKTDAVYINGSGLQLTTGWTIAGAYEHYWTSNLSTTAYLGVGAVEYNNTVINSRWFCGGGGAVVQQITVAATTRCDPGFKLWELGAHTDWYPVPGFRLAAEVGYIFVETAFSGQLVTLTPTGGNGGTAPVLLGKRPGGVYLAKDEGIAHFSLRAQRGFGGIGE
jgi:hypothetical protein